jgi:hypothetical protein
MYKLHKKYEAEHAQLARLTGNLAIWRFKH